MMSYGKLLSAIAALYFLILIGSAAAHHSAAAFNMAHPVSAAGTITRFVWTNPHTFIYMSVPNEKGGTDEWEFEGPSVTVLARQGWKNTSVQPGQSVKLIIAPRKDGTHGGFFLRVIKPDGGVLETGVL